LTGDFKKFIDYYERALKPVKEVGDRAGEGKTKTRIQV